MNAIHILCALVLLSLTALNSQRHQMDVRTHQLRAEVEMRSTTLGTRLLDQFASLPFYPAAGPGDGTLPLLPDGPAGATSLEDVLHLADLDGLSFMVVEGESQRALTYEVTASVRYVAKTNGSFVPTFTPTPHREVTLMIAGDLGTSLSLSRVYTLPS